MRALLDAKANVDASDLVRASALHKAVAHGDTRSCRLLLWRGADHSKPNLYGDQPLHRAVQNGREASAKMLLEEGAMVNAQNEGGDSPLHMACAAGHEAFVRTLLASGAAILATNLRGWAPLHSAASSGDQASLARMLGYHRTKGAPTGKLAAANSLDTVMHVAARALRLPALRWLGAQKGFDTALAMRNSEGNTPLAILHSSAELIRRLAPKDTPGLDGGAAKGAASKGGPAKEPAKKGGLKGVGKKGKKGGAMSVNGLSVAAALGRLGDKGMGELNETLTWCEKETVTATKAAQKEEAAAKALRQKKEKEEKAKAEKAAKAAKAAAAKGGKGKDSVKTGLQR